MQNLKFLFPPRVKGIKIFDSEALFPVGKIYCIGKNYADHAKEMGGAVDRDQPFFFSKPPQSITQSNTISFPTQTNNLHHEVRVAGALMFLSLQQHTYLCCRNVCYTASHNHSLWTPLFYTGIQLAFIPCACQDLATKCEAEFRYNGMAYSFRSSSYNSGRFRW